MSYFRPSSQALGKRSPWSRGKRASSKYLGDTSLPDNSGDHVPPSKNVNLWIVNIPSGITHHEFLGFIRNVGKVRSLVLHPATGIHRNSAAALSFFRRASAQKFLDDCVFGKVTMRGMKLHAIWNRHRVAEPEDSTVSRVLVIEGEVRFANRLYLDEFLSSRIAYDIDEIVEERRQPHDDATKGRIEYRFASWRGQAVLALIALRKEHRHHVLTVEYGKDPCE
ncbi:hypothetical protein F4818DRAFT_443379 [Hypoxylon cercidicola]|nr:hypothetical protein F4818DRAFT_443379 [Hypoxylon cercidicola]